MIAIITDSTCDIPDTLVKQYDILVIPQTIIWGDQQYLDRVDLQPEEFYRRLEVDPVRPTSSLPRRQDVQLAFETAVQQGAEEIIVLTVSSAMSGTFQMIRNVAQEVPIPVHMVDSRGPTMSLGWQVLAAARARQAGAGTEEILRQVEQVRQQLVQLVSMETLEYIQRGGRLGGAVKWVGILLHVRPLVSINHQTGLVEPVTLTRTHKAAVEIMLNRFCDQLRGGENLHVAVLHGNVPEKAEQLATRIRNKLNPRELLVNCTGSALGINTGPGALALCGYAERNTSSDLTSTLR